MLKRCVFILMIAMSWVFVPMLEAGQVTMAAYDFDADYIDEIIRTDEEGGETVIRIYKRIEDSFFYKPLQKFGVSGRLVQVPEIVDVNSDGSKDYFFATGSDMGIIYYDVVLEKFIRTNNFDFEISWPDEEGVEKAILFKEDASSQESDTKEKDLNAEVKGSMTGQRSSTTEKKGSYNESLIIPKSDEGSIL